jgi:hypothetical protein
MSCVALRTSPRVVRSTQSPQLSTRRLHVPAPTLKHAHNDVILRKKLHSSRVQVRCQSSVSDNSMQWPSARETNRMTQRDAGDNSSVTTCASTSTANGDLNEKGARTKRSPGSRITRRKGAGRGPSPRKPKSGPDSIDLIVDAILAQEGQGDIGEAVGAKALRESWLTTLLTRISHKGGVRPAMRVFQVCLLGGATGLL